MHRYTASEITYFVRQIGIPYFFNASSTHASSRVTRNDSIGIIAIGRFRTRNPFASTSCTFCFCKSTSLRPVSSPLQKTPRQFRKPRAPSAPQGLRQERALAPKPAPAGPGLGKPGLQESLEQHCHISSPELYSLQIKHL